MDLNDKLNLQKMLNSNDVQDNTSLIRSLKHSVKIDEDIRKLLNIKQKYSRLSQTNKDEFDKICVSQCNFLFVNYTDIFNKIKKDEIDLNILGKFITTLKRIENEELDQHEGSFIVGKLLKELYVDSALKKNEKLEEKYKNKEYKKPVVKKNISYAQFKKMNQFN